MKKAPLVLAVALGTVSPAGYSFNQDVLAIFLAPEGESRVCGLTDVPKVNGEYAPASHLHRVELYLRCEATHELLPGMPLPPGRSCCEHLTTADAHNLGVCPDDKVAGSVRAAAYRLHCPTPTVPPPPD